MASTTTAAIASRPKLDVAVDKPTPYTFDLGLLLVNDPNPFDSSTAPGQASSTPLEERLAAAARDGAQALVRPPFPTYLQQFRFNKQIRTDRQKLTA